MSEKEYRKYIASRWRHVRTQILEQVRKYAKLTLDEGKPNLIYRDYPNDRDPFVGLTWRDRARMDMEVAEKLLKQRMEVL